MLPKFRVWDMIRNKMCEVNVLRLNHPNGFEPTVLVDEGNGVESKLEIDDCVLMQSTGVKDTNGVEIYEGDIVETISEFEPEKAIIKFSRLEFYLEYIDQNLWNESLKDISIGLEVIGNIYENKELL